MDRMRRNITTFARTKRFRLAIHNQSHFPSQNDVRGFLIVYMFRVKGVWAILPNICATKSFLLQAASESFFIYSHTERIRLSGVQSIPNDRFHRQPGIAGQQKTATPSCFPPFLATEEAEGALSSGEKVVIGESPSFPVEAEELRS
jgi:hypothetical protein